MKRSFCLFLLSLAFIVGCDMEKEIDIALPGHEPQLVVECYLEQGRKFQATVIESSSYFDAPTPPLVPDAEVYITYKDQRIKLNYGPGTNPRTNRFYTHSTTVRMNAKPGDMYGIEVVDGKGRKVTGYTIIQEQVPIQKVEWKFNEKDKAYLLTSFQDDGNKQNYYRYLTHWGGTEEGPQRGFVADDALTNGKAVSFGSGYDYEDGDTLVVSLYNIEKQYYDFLRSVDDARNANGNPFAQPAKIKSSVQGGIGIFTNLAFDRKKIIISRN